MLYDQAQTLGCDGGMIAVKTVLAMLLTKRARALVKAESESARQYTLSSRTSGTTHTCRHTRAVYTPLTPLSLTCRLPLDILTDVIPPQL